MPRSVRLGLAWYRALTWLLPRVLMRQHGAELVEDARVLLLRAHEQRGVTGVTAALARANVDLLTRAPGEWWNEREEYASYDATLRESVHPGERVMRFANDVKLAARGLVKRPGFALIAVFTLALGIGANVAIFAVVNAVLIKPLPYPDSERLVFLNHAAPGLNFPEMGNSAGTMTMYEQFSRSYEHIAAVDAGEQRNLTGSTRPARIDAAAVTPSLFDVLQVEPVRGRRFVETDAQPGAAPVAMLTHTGWSAYFGSAPDIIGRVIQLDGVATEVIGVMGREFRYPDPETAVLLPYRVDLALGFGTFGIMGIARLRPGATVEAAQTEAVQLIPRLPELYPDLTQDFLERSQFAPTITSLRDRTVRDAETTLWIVLGTVAFLLLVACASVANLFLVRAESRTREVAVRLALGATRRRIASIFLAESLLLAAVGGAWGVLLGFVGLRALVAAAPPQLPRLHEVGLDATVVVYAAAISIVAGLAFGTLALLGQLRAPMYGIAREGRAQTAGRDRQRARKVLIATQMALALMLLTGSALMLRSFDRLRAVDPGIRPDGVLTVGVSLGRQIERAPAAATYARILDEVRTLPGVTVAGLTNALPIEANGMNGSSFEIEGRERPEDELPAVLMFAVATDGLLEAFGVELLSGRMLERADQEVPRAVGVVSEMFARDIFDGDPLGHRIRFSSQQPWIEIVGVVRDVRTFGLREPIRPMMYIPMSLPIDAAQIDLTYIVARTQGAPMQLAPAIRSAVQRVDAQVPLTTARTMQSVVDESLADTSATMMILLVAACVALVLGAVGLYGVIGFVVSQRRSEIGVRIALGAMPGQVRAMILRQGLVVAVLGVVIGLAGAVALSRVLESVLFEVSARDPLTFILAPIVLLAVSALAAYLPARRASEVSPLEALRDN